eukprot:m.141660 g.141660  ORF g.141660 m.141660 type:complete len:897 (-) comp30202_c0_seq2:208-2898(-)
MSSCNEHLDDVELQRFIVQGFLTLKPAADVPTSIHEEISNTILACGLSVPNPKYHMMASPDGDAAGNNLLQVAPALLGPALLESPALVNVLSGLLGPGYRIHPHTRAHLRQEGAQTTMWHIDTHKGSWHNSRHHVPHHLMVCYYPQDTTRAMGPTELLPGTQYYCGDNDCESYGRGQLPNLNDQLCSFSTVPYTFNCPAGTVMVMHYDLWHRALECSRPATDRLMLKFAAWRTDPNPMSAGRTIPMPIWPLAQSQSHLCSNNILADPLLDFLTPERHEMEASDIGVGDSATTSASIPQIVRDRILGVLNQTTKEEEIRNSCKDHERDLSHGSTAMMKKLNQKRNRLGMRQMQDKEFAKMEKLLFERAMNVVKDCARDGSLSKPRMFEVIAYVRTLTPSIARTMMKKTLRFRFVRDRAPIWRRVWAWMHGVSNTLIFPYPNLNSSLCDCDCSVTNCACSCAAECLLPSPNAIQRLVNQALSGTEPERLCACYKLAELGQGREILWQLLTDATLKTSTRRTAWYGYITTVNDSTTAGSTTPTPTPLASKQKKPLVTTMKPNVGTSIDVDADNQNRVSLATMRAADGFDADLLLAAKDPMLEIRFLAIKAISQSPRTASSAAYLLQIAKPTGTGPGTGGIASCRVALEGLGVHGVDVHHASSVTALFASCLSESLNDSGVREVSARALAQLSAQIIVDDNHSNPTNNPTTTATTTTMITTTTPNKPTHTADANTNTNTNTITTTSMPTLIASPMAAEERFHLCKCLSAVIPALTTVLSGDPERYVRAHVFETLVHFVFGAMFVAKKDHVRATIDLVLKATGGDTLACLVAFVRLVVPTPVVSACVLAVKALTTAIAPDILKMGMINCYTTNVSVTSTQKAIRWVCCRRRCPITTPHSPF